MLEPTEVDCHQRWCAPEHYCTVCALTGQTPEHAVTMSEVYWQETVLVGKVGLCGDHIDHEIPLPGTTFRNLPTEK